MPNPTPENKSSLLSALDDGTVDDVVATLGTMPSLRIACEEGNYDLYMYLVEKYEYSHAEVRKYGNELFIRACASGSFLIFSDMVDRFKLSAADAREQSNKALREACGNGRIDTAQWLVITFGFTKTDIMGDIMAGIISCFTHVCARGHLDVAKWLTRAFNITRADIEPLGLTVLETYCYRRNVAMGKWFTEAFEVPITPYSTHFITEHVIRMRDLEILRWWLNRSEACITEGAAADLLGRARSLFTEDDPLRSLWEKSRMSTIFELIFSLVYEHGYDHRRR